MDMDGHFRYIPNVNNIEIEVNCIGDGQLVMRSYLCFLMSTMPFLP